MVENAGKCLYLQNAVNYEDDSAQELQQTVGRVVEMARASQDSKHFAPSLAQNESHEVAHTGQLTVLYARI